jgi:hypothetical protein
MRECEVALPPLDPTRTGDERRAGGEESYTSFPTCAAQLDAHYECAYRKAECIEDPHPDVDIGCEQSFPPCRGASPEEACQEGGSERVATSIERARLRRRAPIICMRTPDLGPTVNVRRAKGTGSGSRRAKVHPRSAVASTTHDS